MARLEGVLKAKRKASGHVPWHEFNGSVGAQPGAATLLIGQVAVPPPSWVPRVHQITEQRELYKRSVEACRLAPALHRSSWASILGESWGDLEAWPMERLMSEQLNAIVAMAGHGRLATMRTHIHHLDLLNQREFGAYPLQCLVPGSMSAIRIKRYLQERDEAAMARRRAKEARADGAGGTADGEEADGGGAAATALSVLGTISKSFMLGWPVEHPQLTQFSGRPPTREEGGAVGAEFTLALQFELTAADESANEFVRGSAALGAMQMHVCARTALATRSRRPRRTSRGMAVGATGMDLKKGRWRIAGRPLVMSTAGFGSNETFFDVAASVLDAEGFNDRRRSILRAHNGGGGNPESATAWLDREPTEAEWNATIACICRRRVRSGGAVVDPPLVDLAGPGARMPTMHSLKTSKISLCVALGLHPDYAVEPGAHAGSRMESMSVGGMHELILGMRPRGLKTALRYARAANSSTVAELDCMMFAAARAWVEAVGVAGVPRTGSWAALTAWVTQQLGDRLPDLQIVGGESRAAEPPLPESAESVSADQDEIDEIEVEYEL